MMSVIIMKPETWSEGQQGEKPLDETWDGNVIVRETTRSVV